MNRSHSFAYITLADLVARSAYQMGKTPLLPIFAAALGASGPFLGFIVSVSTLTGMVLKPLFGVFSDRWGRRGWLLAGTAFFAGMPFLYGLIHSPGQLFAIRIVHGLATAIYGPVTLAYVAEQTDGRRAEKLGLFGMARSAGYVVGPAAAGWLLLTMDPAGVFTVIGLLSSLVFVPILLLPESGPRPGPERPRLRGQVLQALKSGSHTPAVWLAGGLESTMYIALYAVRAFLPLYALSLGVSVALVGVFFAVQEAAHMVLKPFGGRLGDRLGHVWAICAGLVALGAALPLLNLAHSGSGLLALSALMGVAQALALPSTVALASTQIDPRHLGAGMGLIGTLKNAGKVIGPVLGGALIGWLDFGLMFRLMGLLVLLGAVVVWYWAQLTRKMKRRELATSI